MSTGEIVALLGMVTAVIVALTTAAIFIGRKVERMVVLEQDIRKATKQSKEDRKKLEKVPLLEQRLEQYIEIVKKHQRYFSTGTMQAVQLPEPTQEETARILQSPHRLPTRSRPIIPREDDDSNEEDSEDSEDEET